MSTSRRSVVVLTAAVLCVPILSSCGLSAQQRAAVQRFSTATTALADVTAEDFTSLRTDVIAFRMRRFEIQHRLDLGEDDEESTSATTDVERMLARLLPTEAADEAIDGGVRIDDLEARLEAVAAMREFGSILGTLSSKGDTANLNTTTGKLLESISKIDGIRLSNAQSTAIQQAVLAVAGIGIEAQRARAVRTVVLQTREVFPEIIKLIREDYDPEHYAWIRTLIEEGEAAAELNEELALMAAIADADAEPADDTDPTLSNAEIASLRDKSASLVTDVAGRVQIASDARPRIVAALDEFETAHVELVSIVQSGNSITSDRIESFHGTVDTLVRTYRALIKKPSS